MSSPKAGSNSFATTSFRTKSPGAGTANNLSWFFERLSARVHSEVMALPERSINAGEILERVAAISEALQAHGLPRGGTIAFTSSCNLEPLALLLALFQDGRTAMPISESAPWPSERLLDRAGVIGRVCWTDTGFEIVGRTVTACSPVVATLHRACQPGLVLLTSGSTGEPRGVLLDAVSFLDGIRGSRTGHRTLCFMPTDHVAGLDVVLQTLAAGGVLVPVTDRTPETICRTIATQQVSFLPTTPTFLRLMLMSGAHQRHDLSSLKLIAYGSEPMPLSTLHALHQALPWVKLKQVFGTTELGRIYTRSRDSSSLWMELGGRNAEVKVVDGVLWIKSSSRMLGYLDSESGLDTDGWLCTGDEVEVRGSEYRILGRRTERINVGGEKVHPTQVEDVLLQAPNVLEVVVRGRDNPITGQVVIALVRTEEPENERALLKRLRRFCRDRLPPWQHPMALRVLDTPLHSYRFKRQSPFPSARP